jgi:hypothetical protein
MALEIVRFGDQIWKKIDGSLYQVIAKVEEVTSVAEKGEERPLIIATEVRIHLSDKVSFDLNALAREMKRHLCVIEKAQDAEVSVPGAS